MKITTFTVSPAPACKGVVTFKTNKNMITLNFADVIQSKKHCPICPHNHLCSLVHNETTKMLKAAGKAPTKDTKTPTDAKTPKAPKIDTTDFPTVQVMAFTGMPIGELPIVADTPTTLTVLTNKQLYLEFDKASGLQTNAAKPHFANRIAPIDLKHPLPASPKKEALTAQSDAPSLS